MNKAAVFGIGALAAILAVLAGGAGSAQTAGPGGRALVFRSQVIMDSQGLGMEAARLLVPKDWTFEGGISWNPSSVLPEAFVAYTVSSPDRASVMQQFRHLDIFWSQGQNLCASYAQMGWSILQPLAAVDFLQRVFIPQARQGASGLKVIEAQPLPETARQVLAEQNLTINLFAQISPYQFPYESRADAGRVKVEYEENGRRMVEDFTARVTYFIISVPTMSGYVQSVTWQPVVTSFRAPAEEMPARIRLFEIAALSRVDNPVWRVTLTRLCALATREQLRRQEAIFARFQQIHKTLEECNDIVWQTYRNRSAAEDRMFDNYIQGLRGVETYVDPVNNVNVDLPAGYGNAWTNGLDYVFSESPSFNPNTISTGNWQKMPARR